MKVSTIYNNLLRNMFMDILQEHNVDIGDTIVCWHQTGEQLGLRGEDYALLRGKEVLLTCKYRNGIGQVFTTTPRSYRGCLRDIVKLDLEDKRNNSIFYAAMNAVLRSLGLIDKTVHCGGEEPTVCGRILAKELLARYGQTTRILHVGYHPGHIEALARVFHDNLIVTDLSSQLIWRRKHGRLVVDGMLNKYLLDQVDIILLTASSIVNGTAWEIIEQAILQDKKVIVYGISSTAAIYLLREKVRLSNIEHYCPYGR